MFTKFFYFFKKSDWVLYIVTILLVAFGLAVLYSILINQESPDLARFGRQVIFVAVGLVLMLIFSFVDYRFFNSYRTVLYITGIILLLLVLVLGQNIRGSTRWFGFFGQTFQPVELVKLFLVFWLAGYLAKYGRQFFHFKHIVISGSMIIVPAVLVALEPKMGYAIMFILFWIIMLFLLKVRLWHLVVILLLIAVIGSIAWLFILEDYQKDRILTFIDPARDPLGRGYNVKQSIIAVGSGQIMGRGLGLGPQSQLNFLPEQETDFIFAVIAEEMGMIGSLLIISFYIILLYRIYLITKQIRENFGLFLVLIILILFSLQIIINIGMNIGLLPVTGIPLPFLSAGGSSLLVSLISIGILQSITARGKA